MEGTSDGVDGWQVGQRVAVNPALWCEECDWCEWGEQCLCESFQILGEHGAGGCAERVAVPTGHVLPVPASVGLPAAGGLMEVFLTAYLNQNFYGNNSYGVSAAARTYFKVHNLNDLTLAQAATLAAGAGLPASAPAICISPAAILPTTSLRTSAAISSGET